MVPIGNDLSSLSVCDAIEKEIRKSVKSFGLPLHHLRRSSMGGLAI